jgi:hypothetical protein
MPFEWCYGPQLAMVVLGLGAKQFSIACLQNIRKYYETCQHCQNTFFFLCVQSLKEK